MSDHDHNNPKGPYLSPTMRQTESPKQGNTGSPRTAPKNQNTPRPARQNRPAPRPLTPAEEELIRKAAEQAQTKQNKSEQPKQPKQSKQAAPQKNTAPSRNTAAPKNTPPQAPKRDIRMVERPKAGTSQSGQSGQQPKPQQRPQPKLQTVEKGKKPKKKIKQNYTLYYVAFGLLASIMIAVLSLTVLFPVDSIKVVSANAEISLTEEQMQRYADESKLELGHNLLRANAAAAEKRVLACDPAIDAVKVKKRLPGTLVIEVNPAQIKYVYYNEQDRTYYAISQNGRVVESGKQRSIAKDRLLVRGFTVENCEIGSFYDEKAVLEDRLQRAERAFEKAGSKDDVDALEKAMLQAESEIRRYQLFEQLYQKLVSYELGDLTELNMKRSSEISFTYQSRIEVKLGGYTDVDYKLDLATEIITAKLDPDAKGVLNLSVPSLPGFREE